MRIVCGVCVLRNEVWKVLRLIFSRLTIDGSYRCIIIVIIIAFDEHHLLRTLHLYRTHIGRQVFSDLYASTPTQVDVQDAVLTELFPFHSLSSRAVRHGDNKSRERKRNRDGKR